MWSEVSWVKEERTGRPIINIIEIERERINNWSREGSYWIRRVIKKAEKWWNNLEDTWDRKTQCFLEEFRTIENTEEFVQLRRH